MRRWAHIKKFNSDIGFDEVYTWCEEMFGKPDKQRWHASWTVQGQSIIGLRDPADALMFKLRWL